MPEFKYERRFILILKRTFSYIQKNTTPPSSLNALCEYSRQTLSDFDPDYLKSLFDRCKHDLKEIDPAYFQFYNEHKDPLFRDEDEFYNNFDFLFAVINQRKELSLKYDLVLKGKSKFKDFIKKQKIAYVNTVSSQTGIRMVVSQNPGNFLAILLGRVVYGVFPLKGNSDAAYLFEYESHGNIIESIQLAALVQIGNGVKLIEKGVLVMGWRKIGASTGLQPPSTEPRNEPIASIEAVRRRYLGLFSDDFIRRHSGILIRIASGRPNWEVDILFRTLPQDLMGTHSKFILDIIELSGHSAVNILKALPNDLVPRYSGVLMDILRLCQDKNIAAYYFEEIKESDNPRRKLEETTYILRENNRKFGISFFQRYIFTSLLQENLKNLNKNIGPIAT